MIQKACDLDLEAFPESPTFDPASGECTVKGKSPLFLSEFIRVSPFFFQAVYFSCRNGEAYGNKVHDRLSLVLKQLSAKPPARKQFQLLVTEFRSAKLAGKINV